MPGDKLAESDCACVTGSKVTGSKVERAVGCMLRQELMLRLIRPGQHLATDLRSCERTLAGHHADVRNVVPD